jgi:hypothetical protein
VPPASGSLPPRMFPRGIPSAALPVAVTSALRTGQLPRQPQVRLAVTRILRPPHPTRPAGRRFPPAHGSAPLHRLPARRPPPPEEAPRPGLRHHVRASHHASGPPRFPQRCCMKALRVRRSCRPHRRLARPPPGATASSAVLVIPGASALLSS